MRKPGGIGEPAKELVEVGDAGLSRGGSNCGLSR